MSTSLRQTGLRLATSSAIALSTALTTAAVVLPAPAFGQNILPDVASAGGATIGPVTPSTTTLNVDVNNASRIIDWNTFNVGSANTVNFSAADTATAFSVLNRVNQVNGASQIDGAIRTPTNTNLAVWIVNQAGIIFGPSGSFSGGRLVLSTMDLNAAFTDANFLAGTGTTRFSGTSTNAIDLQAGSGGIATNGSFVAIGQDITVAKTVTATGGDIALVAARDVSFPVGLGSPLSITVNQGTTLATAKVNTSGALTGNSIRLVGASQGGAIANLLNVSGGSLTATAVGGTIILATAGTTGVTINSAAATDSINAAGSLTASGATADIVVSSTAGSSVASASAGRDVNFTGGDNAVSRAGSISLSAGRSITGSTITATGGTSDLTFAGTTGTVAFTSASAGRDLSITGATITVPAKSAGRDLTLNQTTGALAFDPNSGANTWGRNVSLTAAGNVNVSSLTAFTSPGAISITSTGGDIVSNGAAVAVLAAAAGSDVTLSAANGTVNIASVLTGVTGRDIAIIGSTISAGGIDASRDLSLTDTTGDFSFTPSSVSWGRDIALTASTGNLLVTANLTSPGAARLTSLTNDVRANSVTTTNGAIAVTAAATVRGNGLATMTVAAGGAANGDVTIKGDSTELANVTAARSIAVQATSANMAGAIFNAGEDIALDGNGSINVTTLIAKDDIRVRATDGVTLGTVSTDGSVAGTRTANFTTPAITFDTTAADGGNIGLVSANAALTVSTSARATGAAGNVTLGAGVGNTIDAKVVEAAGGDITLNSNVVTANIDYKAGGEIVGNSIVANNGNLVLLAGTDLRGNSVARMTVSATALAGSDASVTAAGGNATLGVVGAARHLAIKTGAGLDMSSGTTLSGDILIDAGSTAALGNLTAAGSIAARAGGNLTGSAFGGDDVALRVNGAGNTVNVTTIAARDDIDIDAVGAITVGTVSTDSTAAANNRRANLTGTTVAFDTPEAPDHANSSIRLTSANGAVAVTTSATTAGAGGRDILIGGTTIDAKTLTAVRDIAITGPVATTGAIAYTATNGSIKADSVTATNGAISLSAGTDVTGNTVARMNVAANGAASDAAIQATAGQALLGTVTAGRFLTIGAGTSVGVNSGDAQRISIAAGTTGSVGNLTATTAIAVRAAGNLTGGTLDAGHDIGIQVTGAGNTVNITNLRAGDDVNVTAPGAITVSEALARGTGSDTMGIDFTTNPTSFVVVAADGSNVRLTSTGSDITVGDNVTARDTVALSAGRDVLIADYVSATPGPESGFVRSTAGNVTIAATRDVGRIGGTTMVTARGIDAVSATGNLTINGGDVRVDSLTAGGTLNINGISGSLTGTSGTGEGTALTGGGVFAAGTVGINTATAAPNIVRLNRVEAGGAVTIGSANTQAAIGTLRANTLTFGGGAGSYYIGLRAATGDLTETFAGVGADPSSVSQTGTLEAGFGQANLSGNIITATIARNAQLGTVSATNAISITARGLTAAGLVRSDLGSVALTAGTGTLQAGSVQAATTAGIVKNNGLLATAGDELRITGTLTAGGNATVTSNTHARIGQVTSAAGDVAVTATLGDVSGLAGGGSAGDLLPGFGRAGLTAAAVNRTIAVNANGGTAQLGTLSAGTGTTLNSAPQITVGARAIDLTAATASNGRLTLSATAGDAIVGSGTGRDTASVTASGNVRIGSLTSNVFNAAATATNGDVTGLAVTPGAAALASSLTVPLNPSFNAANITGNGAGGVNVTANNGIAQLGTLVGGMNVTVNARALSVNTATVSAGAGLSLTATAGSLVLGTGTVGTGAVLTKTGATGEVDVTSLSTGNLNGSTGAATITSSTSIRAGGITARGADITLTAADGEVTGRGAGGRAVLTAALARNGGGADIAGSDGSVFVTSGTLSRLGAVQAGNAITVQTGDALVAARDGAVDGTTFTAARGNVTLSAFNDAATANGITATSVNAGGSALLRTTGPNGGSITLNSVTAGSNVLLDTSGSAASRVLVNTVTSTGASIGVRSSGLVTGTTYSADADIGVLSAGALTLGTANAGDDIALTGASVSLGTATARGDGADNTSINLGLLPASPFLASGADNANLTIASTAGAVNVTGDLAAQRNLSVTSVGGATTLAGNLTAGSAPVTGNLTVASGGALTLGNAAARTIRATGAVSLTAAGSIGQGAGALAIQSNSDQTGGEALNIVATSGNIALGDTALIGGSVAGRESLVDLRATGGTVSFGKVDASGLTVRADGQVTASGDIAAGNAARAADPLAGFNTVDISTTAGGIQLATVTANGANHDIALNAPGAITAAALTASRNIAVAGGSIDISGVTATTGSIAARAQGDITAAAGYSAGTDIAVSAGQVLNIGTVSAGDDISLTGGRVLLGSATARGDGADTSTIDLGLLPATPFGASAADNANLTIASTAGAIDVTGDLSAQRNISITSVGDAITLGGNLTAGPIAAGDLTVNSGSALTLGSIGSRTVQATGAISLTAAGDITQGAGALIIRSNSDAVGTEALTVSATTPASIALGNTAFIGGSVAGRESAVDVRATGGAVTVGTVDANGLTIRAGGNVTANGAINAGNSARAADPVGTFRTIDIATTVGDISLTSATAIGAGHDILLNDGEPGTLISAGSLTAARSVTVSTSGSANIANATATTGALSIGAVVGSVTLGSGVAGTDGTISGRTLASATNLTTGGALLVEAVSGNAVLGTGVAGGTGTVTATGSTLTTAEVGSLTSNGTAKVTASAAARVTSIKSNAADIDVSANTVTIGIADAATSLSAIGANGIVTIDRGIAGTIGLLRTFGSGDVIVTTSLTTGGAATVTAAGNARLPLVTAATGDITVFAASDVTGNTAGTTGANLAAATGAVQVTNSNGTARLATVSGNGVTVATGAAFGDIVADNVDAGSGALSLVTTNGPVSLNTGRAGTSALVRGSGTATVGSLTAGTNASVIGSSVSITTATAAAGNLLVAAGTGNATVGTGVAGGTGTVQASGNADVTSLTSVGTATLASGGAGTAGTAGTIRSTGADVVANGASLNFGTADAHTTLSATASNGALTIGTGIAGTTAALRTTGGNGDVTVTTSLTTGGAATVTSVGDARLASVTAATGALTVTAANGEVTGVGAGSANLVASAGAVSVEGGALARLGTVGGTGVTVTADAIEAADVNAGTGALSLVADVGGVTLGTGRSGTTALIDARQTATISTGLTAGTSARIAAANAEIGGPVSATTRIDVVNTGTGALVLGDAAGSGFQLTETEVNRLNAPEVALDARSTDIAIGRLAFDGDTGGNRVDILGLGRIDVTGTVSAPGGAAGRAIRFGGSATASDKATVIRVAATATGGGGRLLMPNAAVELRGVKIGVGQDSKFLDTIGLTAGATPITVARLAADFISNPQSTLFYAGNFGGTPYNPIGQILVEASSLTVRTTDYAVFQNTGTIGQSLGVVLDARATSPRVPALSVAGPNPPDAGGFALFGTINGFEASAAALLGATDISIVAVDGANTRINGCIAGSGGGGCLSNSIVQPVVNVFDSSRSDVLKTSSDFEAPFDPVVGTNNESLFGDVGTFGLEDIPLTPDPEPSECGGADQAPCGASEGDKK